MDNLHQQTCCVKSDYVNILTNWYQKSIVVNNVDIVKIKILNNIKKYDILKTCLITRRVLYNIPKLSNRMPSS